MFQDPIQLSTLTKYHFSSTEETVLSPEERFRSEVDQKWYDYEYRWGGVDHMSGRWDHIYPGIEFGKLSSVFSMDDLVKLWVHSPIQTTVEDFIQKNHPFLWKAENSIWRFCYTKSFLNLKQFMVALTNVSCPFDESEFRLTWVQSSNVEGRSIHFRDLWIDAPMALALLHKGRHVLTVGFAPFQDNGVAISQIQLRNKKGNRFLYKLQSHYVDMVLDAFQKAFGTVWIVEGRSAANAVQRAHGPKSIVDPVVLDRIASFYNMELENFIRTDEVQSRHGRDFIKLRSKYNV